MSWSNAGPVERARGICLAPEVQVVAESPLSLLNLPVHSGQSIHLGQTLAEVRDETAWKYRNELEAELEAAQKRVAEQTRQYGAELSRRMAQIDDTIRQLQSQSRSELKPPTILATGVSAVGLAPQPTSRLKELERERLSFPTQIRTEFQLDQLIAKQQECEIALAEWDRLAEPKPWTAPTGGIITGIHAGANSMLGDGALFVTIRDTDHPKVRTELRVSKAQRLEVGQRVTVRFSARTERIGVVESIEPGRRLAGTASFRDDPRYLTLTISPAEEWPTVRQDSGVEIHWCDSLRL